MSRGFNKVMLIGNLARDPDVRMTPTKQKVARITVAVGRQWKNKNTGEMQNQTDFIPVVAWSFLADLCEQYLRKGRPVFVEGRMQVREYTDKTGARKWATEVVAENMVLLSSGRRDDQYGEIPAPRQQAPSMQQMPTQRQSAGPVGGFPDAGSLRDEIPFDEDFPLDFSEMPNMQNMQNSSSDDVDVPF